MGSLIYPRSPAGQARVRVGGGINLFSAPISIAILVEWSQRLRDGECAFFHTLKNSQSF